MSAYFSEHLSINTDCLKPPSSAVHLRMDALGALCACPCKRCTVVCVRCSHSIHYISKFAKECASPLSITEYQAVEIIN